jgi:Winged helix DNA-binding domain
VTPDRLGLRALNRATLERQLLLRRSALTAGQAVAHLAGMQAQAPLAPYVGLWTRLAAFRPHQLEKIFTERAVVRAHLMRNTVHLITAQDFARFRPLYQPMMERALAGHFGRNLAGVDLAELASVAAGLLGRTALTRVQLAAALAPRWPDHEPASLAYAASHLLPLVQVPPRGLWKQAGPAAFMLAEAWLNGQPPSGPAPPLAAPARSTILEQLALRYLAAYGPASVADVQTWSGLTRLREVTERLTAGPGPGCARSPGRTGPGSSTCPTRPARIPASRPRPGSCPSTTTCCSPSPNAPGSSRTAARSRCRPATAPPAVRCWSTGCGRPTGRSSPVMPGPSWRSSRSPSSARLTGTPSRPRGSGSWNSPPLREPVAIYDLARFVRAH